MPRHDAGMARRLGKDLVVPKAQSIDAKQLRACCGDAWIEHQRAQRRVDAPCAEEVADDFAFAFGVGAFDFVELRLKLIESLDDRCHRIAHARHFARSQHIDRTDEAVAFEGALLLLRERWDAGHSDRQAGLASARNGLTPTVSRDSHHDAPRAHRRLVEDAL